jgi:hypothetical protein
MSRPDPSEYASDKRMKYEARATDLLSSVERLSGATQMPVDKVTARVAAGQSYATLALMAAVEELTIATRER